ETYDVPTQLELPLEPRAEEKRGVPKPQPQRPIVANQSTPGIQKPNKPDGRDAPAEGETRGSGKYEGWPPSRTVPALAAVLASYTNEDGSLKNDEQSADLRAERDRKQELALEVRVPSDAEVLAFFRARERKVRFTGHEQRPVRLAAPTCRRRGT